MAYSRTFFCLTVIAGLLALQSPVEAKMYRWVDEQGRIFYSDKVPPQQSKLERKELSSSGRVVNTIKAAKTKEQIALEERLDALRKEQEKIIAKQKANDKVLLSTFRTLDDLKMTLNGKLLSLDAQKTLFERSLENLRENLASAHKKAAIAERSGRQIPVAVLNEITNIEAKISATYLDIAKLLEKRKVIEKKFARDMERFTFLTKSNVSAQELSDETAEITAADALGLFNCNDQKICDRAWEIAREFVMAHSTTGIHFNADTLIMSRDPMSASDLSLSASKLTRDQDKVSIFLDIRCHNSTVGNELCESERVKTIRNSFRPYIQEHL